MAKRPHRAPLPLLSATLLGLFSMTACGDGAATDEATTDTSSETGDTDTGDGTDTDTDAAQCVAQIELPGDTFYPEGTAWTASGELFVASLATGEVVVAKDPCTGEVERWIAPGEGLRNPVGMLVDDARGLLLVCDSNFGFDTPPEIDVFDLASAEQLASHAFASVGFCNDLALDDAGNVYATDSTGARVVRVGADALTSDDSPAQDWAADPGFVVAEGEFGPNGIVYDDAGRLYVGNYARGTLYSVEIAADGEAGAIEAVALGAALAGPDGMKWDGERLLLVEGGKGALSSLDLSGDAPSATVLRDGFAYPTTFATFGARAWVAEGQLDHFLGVDAAPPELPFVLTRVDL